MNELSDPQIRAEGTAKPRFRLLRTGLLMAGSALLGGLAVVLWHRNSLVTLRQPEPNRAPKVPDAESE